MRTVYEATRTFLKGDDYSTYRQTEQEFDTKEAAKAHVDQCQDEDYRGGKVITWAVSPNLPGCLPAERYNSCALEVFDNGAWKGVNIHE